MNKDLGDLTGSHPTGHARCAVDGASRFDPGRVADLELALDLACRTLGDMEPGDGRAVSNEFVAMLSILCGCPNEEARQIIRRAIECHKIKIGEAA